MKMSFLQLHTSDNVLVALQDLPASTDVHFMGETIKLQGAISAKHKFFIHDLHAGDDIIMYGTLVGKVVVNVQKGELMDTKNTRHAASSFGERTQSYSWEPPDVSHLKNLHFRGFHRPDGQVGVRNYWLVIPLVFCENKNVDTLREAFLQELGYTRPNPYRKMVRALVEKHQRSGKEIPTAESEDATNPTDKPFPSIDGIRFLQHDGGCGGTREDSNNLCMLLAGYVANPNVAGATILSLGCQHAQIPIFQEALNSRLNGAEKPVFIFEQQQYGTEQAMLEAAISATFEGLIEADRMIREPAPLSKLSIGVKCGGSDGFSGISANPAVGHAADLLVALGGKVVMAEFPELCGVEQELINRCVDDETAARFAHLMKTYGERAIAVGSGFDMNPSPGNIRDGLITDAIKSAGAAKKGGTSPVADVLPYGHYLRRNGLTLLCTPGNDVESTSGMAGSGCTIQLFTTGLGTPTGNPVSPMVKIATNHALTKKMPDIIDINCGDIIAGETTIEESGEEILQYIIRLASGETETCAERNGQEDFIFWKRGVSL
jgi:altronate hydrolase